MINEGFVLETDKHGQILALVFGFSFFFFFAKPGRLVDLCLFQSKPMVMVCS